jgi:type VI protein secretion system component Hcp
MANQQKENEPAVDVYILLEGIKGPVTEPGHEGWIKGLSAQFGVGLAIGGRNRRYRRNQTPEQLEAERKKKEDEEAEAKAAEERGETEEEAWERKVRSSVNCSSPSVSEVTVTKESDAASPVVFHHTVLRKPVRRAVVEVVQRSDKATTRFEMDTVFISGFSLSIGRNNRPQESMSLNFQSITFGVRIGEQATTSGYDLTDEVVSLNGEPSKPFWEKKDGDDNDY